MNWGDRVFFGLVLGPTIFVLVLALTAPIRLPSEPPVVVVVGQPARHIRVAVPRSAFIACVEALDPDAADLTTRINQCAGLPR